jgi:hypothetical protein
MWMRTVILAILAAFCLALYHVAPSSATDAEDEIPAAFYVLDMAGFMSGSEARKFELAAHDLAREYECGVHIAIVRNFDDAGANSGAYARDFFKNSGFGIGRGKDGVLLLVSMETGDYVIVANGDYANAVFTATALDNVSVAVERESAIGGLLTGMSGYQGKCAELLEKKAAINSIKRNDLLGDPASGKVGLEISEVSSTYRNLEEGGYMTKIDISKLHTTEMGIDRIKRNLNLDTDNVVDYCKQAILSVDSDSIIRKGKNWYVNCNGYTLTINAHSNTIITAHTS